MRPRGFPDPLAGVVDSGSWDSFSRFAHAVGGRTIVWRIRDEMTSVLRDLLTVCGEVLVSFLGDGSVELAQLAIVGPTFQYGVPSGVGRFRWSQSAPPDRVDVAQAYLHSSGVPLNLEEDWQDDPTIDEHPHHVFVNPQPDRNPAIFTMDSSSFDDEVFSQSSSSVSSIVPSEPEHEPSIVSSGPVGDSSDLEGFRASIPICYGCYGQNQYQAERECLLVVYLDDVLRIPMPGWPRQDILSIVQGLSGDWTTFYALIERGPPTPEPSGAVGSEPLLPQTAGHLLAIEDASSAAFPSTYAALEEIHLLLGLGGFNLGVMVAGIVLGTVIGFESSGLGV